MLPPSLNCRHIPFPAESSSDAYSSSGGRTASFSFIHRRSDLPNAKVQASPPGVFLEGWLMKRGAAGERKARQTSGGQERLKSEM